MNSIRCKVSLLSVLMSFPLSVFAATHYVVPPETPGVTPDEPYSSWETAGTDIATVVAAAMNGAGEKLVWVADGTYYPENTVTASGLTLRSVNGREATIIDGRDNSGRGFDFVSVTIDGFTITNHITSGNGAGLEGDKIKLYNCIVTDNESSGGVGGGARVLGSSIISNCVFRNNLSFSHGAGVYFGSSNIKIIDCQFENNASTGVQRYGGGVYLVAAYDSIISNCYFEGNSAYRGGAIGTLTTPSNKGQNLITHCTIVGNTATERIGGGLYIDTFTTAEFCDIRSNVVKANNGYGGGVGGGGSIRNCLVALNQSADKAGGFQGAGFVESCTVAGNSASNSVGGVWQNSSAESANNIIYHNFAPTTPNYLNETGEPGLIYSCTYPAVEGTGNITNDPRFADFEAHNFRIRSSSPCVDAGINLDWMEASNDLDGNPRIRYGVMRGTADMGAYEGVFPLGSMLLLR